jgi:hypothetical protein
LLQQNVAKATQPSSTAVVCLATSIHPLLLAASFAQVVIDYPTPTALSQFITKQVLASSTQATPAPAASAAAPARPTPSTHAALPMHPTRPLAMSDAASQAALVVLAAAARSPAGQLGTGAAQYDPVGVVPLDRWDLEADFNTSTSARWAT